MKSMYRCLKVSYAVLGVTLPAYFCSGRPGLSVPHLTMAAARPEQATVGVGYPASLCQLPLHLSPLRPAEPRPPRLVFPLSHS